MRRCLRIAARLYPRSWRARYEAEFDTLLEDLTPMWRDLFNVVRAALILRARRLPESWKLVAAGALAGLVIATAAALVAQGPSVSSVVIRASETPESADRVRTVWQEALSRRSLSELIQRPTLDLYRDERMHRPLQDVIEEMRRQLRLDVVPGNAPDYRVSFVYPDQEKAKRVVAALTTKVMDLYAPTYSNRSPEDATLHIVSPASLPAAALVQDRRAFLFTGLALGLLSGILIALLRWRAKWTLKVLGCGFAGWVAAGAAALLIPNRYTSQSHLRVLHKAQEGGIRRYLQDAELAAWLQKKSNSAFSDDSLAKIIERPVLDLYHREREHALLPSVIANMRRNLVVRTESHSMIDIEFTYHDRFKAQAVVLALVSKLLPETKSQPVIDLGTGHDIDKCIGRAGDAYVSCVQALLTLPQTFQPFPLPDQHLEPKLVDLLDPPNLPETPVAPDRRVLAGAGLAVGLFLGAYFLGNTRRTVLAREVASR